MMTTSHDDVEDLY